MCPSASFTKHRSSFHSRCGPGQAREGAVWICPICRATVVTPWLQGGDLLGLWFPSVSFLVGVFIEEGDSVGEHLKLPCCSAGPQLTL